MIDSSGRRALQANGTVLDLMPVGQIIAVTGVLLVLLFVSIKPEASNGLGVVGRTLFWIAHVGLGLAALGVASRWLGSRNRLPCNTWAAVFVTGVTAVIIAAPGYLALDFAFADYVFDLDPEPEKPTILTALAEEILDLGPWFLLSWIIINLPVLLPRPMPIMRMEDAVEHSPEDFPQPPSPARETLAQPYEKDGDVTRKPHAASSSLHVVDNARSGGRVTPQTDYRGERFLSTLPGIVGTDVIAVASDLHYLNVWTVAGRSTVLGNLRDVVNDLGDAGMQVHRSHWVAHKHVRRIVGTASYAACILSNELRVPISRRRWKAVREQYGRGVVNTSQEEPPSAQSL